MKQIKSKRSLEGVTLIELLIVVAIVVIISAIAIPSYQKFTQKGRRADGIAALSALQLEQQRLRSGCPWYAVGFGGSTACGATAANATLANKYAVSDEAFYSIAISSASSVSFVAVATGQNGQQNDSCGAITYTYSNTSSASGGVIAFADASCN